MNKLVSLSVLSVMLVITSSCVAPPPPPQPPVVDIGHRHPRLAEAQRLCREAYNKISEAQASNEYDMGGHAERAKELLDQVDVELKAAAMDANAAHR